MMLAGLPLRTSGYTRASWSRPTMAWMAPLGEGHRLRTEELTRVYAGPGRPRRLVPPAAGSSHVADNSSWATVRQPVGKFVTPRATGSDRRVAGATVLPLCLGQPARREDASQDVWLTQSKIGDLHPPARRSWSRIGSHLGHERGGSDRHGPLPGRTCSRLERTEGY